MTLQKYRVVAIVIAFTESTFLLPPVEKILDFFLENYLWRIIVYVMLVKFPFVYFFIFFIYYCVCSLAIPTFLSFVTFVGGLLILVGCAGYGYCVYAGEKPTLAHRREDPNKLQDGTGNQGGLLSNYQLV